MPLLLDEVYRILKDDGILSIYPEHVDTNKLTQIIMKANFRLEKKFFHTLIHDSNLKKGYIWNFKKVLK